MAEKDLKRKRSWSLFSWLPFSSKKRKQDDDEKDEEVVEVSPELNLVSLVLRNDTVKLSEKVVPPSELPKEKDDSVSRVALVDANPLCVATKINLVDAARILLGGGWKVADDRTAYPDEVVSIPSLTPLGIALEKRNDVLSLFLKHVANLEKLGYQGKPRLQRAWSTNHLAATGSSGSVSEEKDDNVRLVQLVIDGFTEELEKELKTKRPKPTSAIEGGLSYSEREKFAALNPLYVAAKLGRHKAAELLLEYGWKMTDDLTAGEGDDVIPFLTPLGASYANKNGVLDIFLNHILTLETAHPDAAKKLSEDPAPADSASLPVLPSGEVESQ
jgi:hypothetical protein